jgi:hypothetical protein
MSKQAHQAAAYILGDARIRSSGAQRGDVQRVDASVHDSGKYHATPEFSTLYSLNK